MCHSQYNYGVPIQVSVYEDKMYIANCGRLPENWTVENLMRKHPSKPYNPNIAYVFYLADFIESWGRGIEKILEACEADGLSVPEFTVNPGDVMIKFSAPEDKVVRKSEKVTEKVTEKELNILKLLEQDPGYTYSDLADKLSVSRKTISEKIKILKNKGILERIGSDKKGYWKIN